ncbi:hypothetical protein [Asticcacaulis sp. 201]|uniref:hypothetical protein n=1 Tax=Asticcacaulis sp. 201 TaxID=3028787 RepID=UPI00291674CE|nr:hypothetical protein [Asticcacaulis sp. 201]MDV6331062.1 hypothetical protein [Asticcacaulis sp. 201]
MADLKGQLLDMFRQRHAFEAVLKYKGFAIRRVGDTRNNCSFVGTSGLGISFFLGGVMFDAVEFIGVRSV